MAEPPFKPSEVNLVGSLPPLCATFNRSELECAAAYYILACRHYGDEWKALEPRAIGQAMRAIEPDSYFGKLLRNPFWQPDFPGLVEAGFARFTEPELGLSSPVELTELGFERLARRWAKPAESWDDVAAKDNPNA